MYEGKATSVEVRAARERDPECKQNMLTTKTITD